MLSRFALLAMVVFAIVSPANHTAAATCGDANGSNQVDIADAVYLINYIFAGGPAPTDDADGDFNCNSQTDIVDAVFMVNYIFASGPTPCSGPDCTIGTLLTGDPDSLAVSATYKYGPFAARSSEIDSTGLFTTRLDGVLNPTATIGDVNAVLNSIDGRVSWMLADGLSLTIATPAMANRQEADSIAGLLVESGAFLFAFSTFQPELNATATAQDLPPTGTSEIFHLLKMHMPAAWNLKKLVEDMNANVTVFVPDGYYNTVPHPEISSQVFVTGNGSLDLISTTGGNHGFCTSGIIGANHDNANTTGVHSNPANGLAIRSMPTGGLTMPEILSEIVDNMPAGRFVLNTSLGFAKDISEFSKAKRAIQAMDWRRLARVRKDDFIHVSSAGNEGTNTDDSRYASLSSAFNVAAAYGSPFELYAPGEIGPLDFLALHAFWSYNLAVNPLGANRMDNLIVVGASDVNGNESAFSNVGSVVRTLGEEVAAPCVRVDPADVDGGCFETTGGLHISYYDGTSFSAPQVAGVAAYLLSLDPLLSNAEIKDIIYNSFADSPNPGFVDAYGAVLALDTDLSSATVRAALLDVANASDQEVPDETFDEHDLQLFLAKFAEYEQLRSGVPNAPADYSRYDLNGDGYTGGPTYLSKFDLDINEPPQYSLLSVPNGGQFLEFNEAQIIDFEALCYYAHTTLYTGSIPARDSILFDCACAAATVERGVCGLWVLDTFFPDYLVTADSALLSVRAGRLEGSDTLWQAAIEIHTVVSGGSAAVNQGVTDANGYFNTQVIKDTSAILLEIAIEAVSNGMVVSTATETAHLRPQVEPIASSGEFCVEGNVCTGPNAFAPLNIDLAGSQGYCEGFAGGVLASSTLSCTNLLHVDQASGSLESVVFTLTLSGSSIVEVTDTNGESCQAGGSSYGALSIQFAVHEPVQFIYTPQISAVDQSFTDLNFELIMGADPVIIQNSYDPEEPIEAVSMTLAPGEYSLAAGGSTCCGALEYLSFNIQFVPIVPVVSGAFDNGRGEEKGHIEQKR